jgi:peptidoglycan/xylan/chitin deacetylase (PgdA/CDA1 family)
MNAKPLVTCTGIGLLALSCPAVQVEDPTISNVARREVAVTLDDLPGVQTFGSFCNLAALEQLNRTLVNSLTSQAIPATGFVVESRLCEEKSSALSGLLRIWLDAGLELGNHSFSHLDLNDTPLSTYEADVIRGEAATRRLLEAQGRRMKYFRHPYLHAGKDLETKRAFESFLSGRGYQVAPVTVDNQEWVFAEVYARALRRRDPATRQRVGSAYIAYMEDMFAFFERLSIDVLGYEVKQTLLLHANPLNADYLDELAAMLRRRGYAFITLEQALADPAYRLPDTYAGPEGLSWLHRWSLGKGMTMKREPREPEWIRRLLESPEHP